VQQGDGRSAHGDRRRPGAAILRDAACTRASQAQ
jgi:hypothetical protein